MVWAGEMMKKKKNHQQTEDKFTIDSSIAHFFRYLLYKFRSATEFKVKGIKEGKKTNIFGQIN